MIFSAGRLALLLLYTISWLTLDIPQAHRRAHISWLLMIWYISNTRVWNTYCLILDNLWQINQFSLILCKFADRGNWAYDVIVLIPDKLIRCSPLLRLKQMLNPQDPHST